MNSVRWLHSVMLATVVLAAASAVPAQQQADSAAQAAYNAHQDEFDFLLGDWEFVQTRLPPAAARRLPTPGPARGPVSVGHRIAAQ